jgi:SpoVK/Ycf46/Vps4 family AAA+-type ATPase
VYVSNHEEILSFVIYPSLCWAIPGKYSGDAELILRLLFDEAKRHAPSVVFFDEMDGLVPVRGSMGGGEGDQIYASVVSTLLALLDGCTPRGQVPT